MKIRGLLIAVLVLAGLSGLVYWSNEHEKAKENEPDPDAPPKIIDVEKDTLVRLEIERVGEATVVLEKGEDGKWALTTPEALRADSSAVDSLVSTFADLGSNRLIEESTTELGTFGLNSPALVVTADQSEGRKIKLLVGSETPTGGNFFAKLEDDPRIFTLASYSKTSLEKSAWDLRDKRLLTFDSNMLSRLGLTAKGPTIEIGKNAHNDWQILKPKPMRADGGNVEQLISRLGAAKMSSEMSPADLKAAAGAFGKASPVAVVEVTDASGEQQLEVRKTAGGDYYAKSSLVEGVYKIDSSVGEGVDKGLADLRNKKLFDFGWTEPSRIEVRDGSKTTVYEKTENKWTREGTEMDSVKVRALIDELRDLSAESFPESGFTEPYLEVTVVSGDAKREEKILISKSGEDYFAKRDGEASIYQLSAADADRLQAVAGDIKEPSPDDEKPAEE